MAQYTKRSTSVIWSILLGLITLLPLEAVEFKLLATIRENSDASNSIIDDDYFILNPAYSDNHFTIRRIDNPLVPWKTITAVPEPNGSVRHLGGSVSQGNMLFFSRINGLREVFNPRTGYIGPILNPAELEDDCFVSVLSGDISKKSVLFNTEFAGNPPEGASKRPYIDFIVDQPEGLFYREYIPDEDIMNFPELIQWSYPTWPDRAWAHNIAYSDKFKSWFQIEARASWFYIAQQKDDNTWEGQRGIPKDFKNRKDNYSPSNVVPSWKFLNPRMVIGPYSPLEGDFPIPYYSLEALDLKGNITPTDFIDIISFDISPNGRYLLANGTNRRDLETRGTHPTYVYLYEISYSGTINDNRVRMRRNASLDGGIITVLDKGQACLVIERTEYPQTIGNVKDCWYKIRLSDGSEGWVFGGFLDFY